MSLGSGVVFGGLLCYGAYRTSADPRDFMFLLGLYKVGGVLFINHTHYTSCKLKIVLNCSCISTVCIHQR